MAFFDNFDRANENLEASPNWTLGDGIAGLAAIRSNKLASLATAGQAASYRCPNQGSANHYVEFTVSSATPGLSGSFVCCRLADSANFVGIRNDGTTLQVYKRVADTLTQLHSTNGLVSVGSVLRLECEAGAWRAFVDGTLRASGSDRRTNTDKRAARYRSTYHHSKPLDRQLFGRCCRCNCTEPDAEFSMAAPQQIRRSASRD